MRLATGDLILDAHALEAMADGTRLAVMGQVKLPQVVDDGLLARKVSGRQVLGSLLCHEENAVTL